jgi:SAM-dependent methyltransferase
MRYTAVEEGDLVVERTASVPDDVDRDRVSFVRADPGALPLDLPAPFDAVVAANLLCRLPDPAAFLHRLPSLVSHGGVAVLASPHDWREACTPRAKWLGGFRDQRGGQVWTAAALAAAMEDDFELVEARDVPSLFREHARRFVYGVSHVTVWRRR